MKNVLFLIAILFSQLAVYGNENIPPRDLISRFRPGFMWYYSGLSPYDTTKLRKYNRLIFDISHTTMHNKFKSLPFDWRSLGFAVSLMFDKPITKLNTFGLGYGIAYSHSSFFTRSQFLTDYPNGKTTVTDSLLPVSHRQKLSANYLEIPLEVRFRTKNWQHAKFHLGAKLGWQINAYLKEQPNSNKNHPVKTFNFPDRNLFRYGAYTRIGVRNWALFGAYYFSPFFTNKNSTQLSSIELGLSISLF
jgi:hypothetical protein